MKQILPIIMNTSFVKLGVIDDYQSLIWTTRYYASGDFELVVPVNSRHVSLLKQNYYIMRDDYEDDLGNDIGVIEDIEIKRTKEGKEQMIVSGRFLGGAIISRRIIAKQTTLTGEVTICIENLLEENLGRQADADRVIPNFYVTTTTNTGNMNAQYTGQNLLTVIEDICKTYNLGYRVILDNDNDFHFRLYKGVDRTYNQSTYPYVVFSDKYDNLLSSEYSEDYKTIVNAALVAGEGEGLNRVTVWAADTSGLNRREIYVDRRDIRKNETSELFYKAVLFFAGWEKLSKYTSVFGGTVYFDNIKFREDVNMGDLVVIQNDKWGLKVNARLIEVIESVSEAGMYSIVPTFGI